MLADAQVGLARMSRRILITGLSTLLGRPAGAGARARRRRRGDHRRLARGPDVRAASARSTSASAPSTRCCAGSSTRPRSTPWSTRAWSSTPTIAPARVAHEMNVLGTMNILAACGGPDSPVTQGRLQVLRALLRLRARRPELLHRGDAPPAPAAHAAGVRHRRGRGRRAGVRGAATPKVTVTTLRFCNGLGPDLRTEPQRAAEPARGPRHPRLRPALPVHPRGRHRRRAPPRRPRTTCPASTTPRPTACWRCREVASLLGKPFAPLLPPLGTGLAAAATGRIGDQDPRRGPPAAALRARSGQPQAQAVRLPLRAHDARRRCRNSPPRCG